MLAALKMQTVEHLINQILTLPSNYNFWIISWMFFMNINQLQHMEELLVGGIWLMQTYGTGMWLPLSKEDKDRKTFIGSFAELEKFNSMVIGNIWDSQIKMVHSWNAWDFLTHLKWPLSSIQQQTPQDPKFCLPFSVIALLSLVLTFTLAASDREQPTYT